MANDRIYLHCKVCDALTPLFVYFPYGNTRMSDIDRATEFFDIHVSLCSRYGAYPLDFDDGLWIDIISEVDMCHIMRERNAKGLPDAFELTSYTKSKGAQVK